MVSARKNGDMEPIPGPPMGTHNIRKIARDEKHMKIVLDILNTQVENYSEENGISIQMLSDKTGMNRGRIGEILRKLRGRGKAFIGAKIGYRRSLYLWFKTNGIPYYHMK